MFTAWSLARFAHVLAAIPWVGGQLTLSLVATPMDRDDPIARTVLADAIGRFLR